MSKLYNPFDAMTFTYDFCFLCGKSLNSYNSSVEHIFPQWLLKRYSLWDRELVLINQTVIKYKNLVVPCCKDCNNTYLSAIEKIIKSAVSEGYSSFVKIDEMIILQWVLKIKYALLFKELSLKLDRTNKDSPTIIQKEDLEDFEMMFVMLQSIRFKTEFHGSPPWSLLIFNVFNDDNEYFGDD